MLELLWNKIYVLPKKKKNTLDSKAREFQCKLLTIELSIQTRFYIKCGKRQHLCVPFVAGLTNPWSIYSFTEFACSLWLSVTNYLEGYGEYVNVLSAADITVGIYEKDLRLINHIVLLGKQIIYQRRGLSLKPSLRLFIEIVKYRYKLESWIAESSNSLDIHENKCHSLLSA